MVQCFLEVSLPPAWKLPGVLQGRGRRWPKKKPSGSESEEEEQVGQGSSSLGSMGVSRGPCSRPLGASALSPARHSCSGLDASRPLWVSGLELAAAAKAAPVMVAECTGARPPSSTLSSPASPAPGRVRQSYLSAASLPPGSGRGGPWELGPASRPAPGWCAPPPPGVLSRAPRSSPPPPTRGRRRSQSRSESRAATSTAARGGFGRPLERSGQGCAVRAAGPEARVWGGAVGGRGRCWRDGTAWDRGEGPSPGKLPPLPSPSRCPLPL